jgi:hypothetical protein
MVLSTSGQLLAAAGVGDFPYFTAVYVIGFVAAIAIGSLAWYNSKRPAGWENKARPDFMPKVADSEDAKDGES